jgi:cyanophycin synthetase
MLEAGAIAAATFDEIVFRQRPEGRGRPEGQVMSLLMDGALAAGFPPDRIRCVADEFEAAEACLRMARPGDLVVLTPASVEEIWRKVLAFDPGTGASRPWPAAATSAAMASARG